MSRPAQQVRVVQRVSCPACRAGLGVGSRDAAAVYTYARVYLGDEVTCGHREVWDAADKREHARERARGRFESGCPWTPSRCERCNRGGN